MLAADVFAPRNKLGDFLGNVIDKHPDQLVTIHNVQRKSVYLPSGCESVNAKPGLWVG